MLKLHACSMARGGLFRGNGALHPQYRIHKQYAVHFENCLLMVSLKIRFSESEKYNQV
jgi:hypothetical protein